MFILFQFQVCHHKRINRPRLHNVRSPGCQDILSQSRLQVPDQLGQGAFPLRRSIAWRSKSSGVKDGEGDEVVRFRFLVSSDYNDNSTGTNHFPNPRHLFTIHVSLLILQTCPPRSTTGRDCPAWEQPTAPQPTCANGQCSDSVAKALACDILAMSDAGQIWLKPDHFDPLGNSPPDGASAYDNIRDTCDGCVAKRY